MSEKVKVAVVYYYSSTGTVYELAMLRTIVAGNGSCAQWPATGSGRSTTSCAR